MKIITLAPTARIIEQHGVRILISYETVMAFQSKYEAARIRSPSSTTSRHLSKAGMADFPILDQKRFQERLDVVMASAPLTHLGLTVVPT